MKLVGLYLVVLCILTNVYCIGGKSLATYSKVARLKPLMIASAESDLLEQDRIFANRYGNRKFYNILSKENENGVRELTYYGQMVAGAIARSVSATAIHPLNVIKTMLQCRNAKMPELKWNVLWRGSGAQLIMSIPHVAFNFAVTEVR